MFRFLYNSAVAMALILLVLIWPFNKKLKHFLKQRKLEPEHKGGDIKFWIHCASLGEFEMARPIINEILRKHTSDQLLISFFSPSGYVQAIKEERIKDSVIYLPIESEPNVKNFYEKYNPEIAIFVRYELWYHYLNEGIKRSVEFYLLNARFKENHFIFKWYGAAYRKLLNQFKRVFVSDIQSKGLLTNKGFKNVSYTGDIRYDRLNDLITQSEENEELKLFKSDKLLVILGSSWGPEESILADAMKQLTQCKFIIAPHSIEEDRLKNIELKFKEYEVGRISESGFNSNKSILILDSIGQLSSLYKYAEISFVGGGFSGALHNIIEPLAWGSAVLFGPKIDKFPEAIAAINAGVAQSIQHANELIEYINSFQENETSINRSLIAFNRENLGAKKTVLTYLKI